METAPNMTTRGKTPIAEFPVNGTFYVAIYQGSLSPFDVLIKYRQLEDGKWSHIRTPKHIHWAVDLLLKMQEDKNLTKEFIKELKKEWEKSLPLSKNDENTLVTLVDDCIVLTDVSKYQSLDKYGEYDIEFLVVLMNLLMTQEKTNDPNAFMFGKILDALLNDDLDIFAIMSTAGFGGHRG